MCLLKAPGPSHKQGQNMGPADSLALYHRMNSLPEVQEIMDALMRATTCSSGPGSVRQAVALLVHVPFRGCHPLTICAAACCTETCAGLG